MSKNKFEIYGDKILISHPNWDFIASATIRDDYAEELQSKFHICHIIISHECSGEQFEEKLKEMEGDFIE